MLYIIPLGFLFSAFLIQRGESAPTAESLRRYFPAFPVSTLKDRIDAMLIAEAKNAAVNELKAARVDLATIITGVVTAIVLISQFGLAWQVRDIPTAGVQTKPAVVVPAGAHRIRPTRGNPHP